MVQHHDTIHFHPKVVLLQKWMNPSLFSTFYSEEQQGDKERNETTPKQINVTNKSVILILFS